MTTTPPAPPTPGQLQRVLRWRWWRRLALWVALGVLVAWGDRRGWFWYQGSDATRYDGRTLAVVHIVDGDTLDVDRRDGKYPHTRIRLWGVNCPEIAHPEFGKTKNDPLGPEATDFTRHWTLHQDVKVILEPGHTRDGFNRLLAYVVLPDGSVLNERLLAQGLAVADNRPGDPRFVHHDMQRYAAIERLAKLDQVGLWAPDVQAKTTSRPGSTSPASPSSAPAPADE